MIAAKALSVFEEEARQRQREAGGDHRSADAQTLGANLRQAVDGKRAPKASEQAASMMRVSPRSVESASKVLRDGVVELAEAVERGEVSVSAAAAVASESAERQRELVAAGPEAVREGPTARRHLRNFRR